MAEQDNTMTSGQEPLKGRTEPEMNNLIDGPQSGNDTAQPMRRVNALTGANVALGVEGRALSEGLLNIGTHPGIEIPDEAQQRAGFNVPDEMLGPFTQQYPQFKMFTPLGGEQPEA